MKIETLGVGGAFSPEIGNTSFLIWNDDETSAILMDCGYIIYPTIKLIEKLTGRSITDKIDRVFISHLHADHAGSIGTLLQDRFHVLHKTTMTSGVALEDFLKQITSDGSKFISDIDSSVTLLPTEHSENLPSFGAFVHGVLYSGDTTISLLTSPEAKEAKIIIHECALKTNDSHIGIEELAASAPDKDILAKTWLTHYSPKTEEELAKRAKELGFAGLLAKGQIIEF